VRATSTPCSTFAVLVSRREFLTGVLAAGVCTACGSRESPSDPGTGAAEDFAAFPSAVPLYREDFENWAGELNFKNLRTCAPRSPQDVVEVANWAAQKGYALRPRGAMHNWSPLSLSFDTTEQTRLVLADTTQHLKRMEMVAGPVAAVRVETGATLEELMSFLESNGYGFTSMPVLGNITIGGAMAIDAHGCGAPAIGEAGLPGQTYGTMSNRVLALTAVVWSPDQGRYALRRFERSDPETGALLVSLGRAFITEVTLMVEPNENLRCVSYVDIPASEMFAPPGSGGRTLASFVDEAGRIEAIWFGFTENPWLKVWSLSPNKPPTSRAVSSPYNYPFTDSYPKAIVDLTRQSVTGNPAAGALVGPASYAVVAAGLTATSAGDLWGPSKNLLLWLKPTTLRVHHFSYVVVTRRDQVQRVVSDYAAKFLELRDAYQAQGKYPINMPMELRVTGLDQPAETGVAGARTASLSAVSPHAARPDWDTAVWLSLATTPGTPGLYAFYREFEQWMHGHFAGDYASLRPEWSKSWAYTDDAAWQDAEVLRQRIPQAFRAGRPASDTWDAAIRQLDALDPAGIYRNDFLARLLSA
jgi:FAD/FMN-containing dehydrogenase